MRTVDVRDALAVTESSPGTKVAGQKLSVGASVLQFGGFHKNTKVVLVTFDTNAVRVRFDGTDPDGTTGNYYAAGTIAYWSVDMARSAKFIQASAGAVVFGTELTY